MDNKSSVASFFDLRAWQEGHKLVLVVYKVTRSWLNDERYGLTSQIRRAASSIAANIAEGFARYHSWSQQSNATDTMNPYAKIIKEVPAALSR